MIKDASRVVTMGCSVAEDSKGQSIEKAGAIQGEIRRRVEGVLVELNLKEINQNDNGTSKTVS